MRSWRRGSCHSWSHRDKGREGEGSATMELYFSSCSKAARATSTKTAASSLADEVRSGPGPWSLVDRAGRTPHRPHVVTGHLGRPGGLSVSCHWLVGDPRSSVLSAGGALQPWLCGSSLPLFIARVGRPHPRKYSPTAQRWPLRTCSQPAITVLLLRNER